MDQSSTRNVRAQQCSIRSCSRRRAIYGDSQSPLCSAHRQELVDEIMATQILGRCIWPGCHSHVFASIRLCDAHLAIAGMHALRHPAVVAQIERMSTPPKPKPEPITDGVVYFLRVGGFIKIGWTSNLNKRMRQYQPDTQLLAVKPGTRKDETALHRKFGHLKTHGREWFPLAPQITDEIDRTLAQHGAPPAVDWSARKASRIIGPRLDGYVGGPNRGDLPPRKVAG